MSDSMIERLAARWEKGTVEDGQTWSVTHEAQWWLAAVADELEAEAERQEAEDDWAIHPMVFSQAARYLRGQSR